MQLIELRAIRETIDVKKGGLVTYETEVTTDGPGIILLNNPDGKFGVNIVNQIHEGGLVKVMVRPISHPVLKPSVGEVVGQLAVF